MQVFNVMCTTWTPKQCRSKLDNWGGSDIHIFVFCVINFFRNPLSVNTNI